VLSDVGDVGVAVCADGGVLVEGGGEQWQCRGVVVVVVVVDVDVGDVGCIVGLKAVGIKKKVAPLTLM